MKSSQGFTLIELVAVVIILGILSTVAASRFSGRGGLVEYAARDQLRSAYRYAQQHAMYDHSATCYRLWIDGNGFGAQRDSGAGFAYFGPLGEVALSGDYAAVSVTELAIYFDGLGNARSGSCAGSAIGTTDISVAQDLSLTLRVHPSGYIQTL